MIRTPTYKFSTLASTGLHEVPEKSILYVGDLIYILSDKTSVTSLTTMQEAIDNDWINVSGVSADDPNTWTDLNTFNEIDMNNTNIDNTKIVLFDGIYDNGTKVQEWTFTPENGQYQQVLINADCSMLIAEPSSPGTFYLHIHNGNPGGVLTFPIGKWSYGVPKATTQSVNGHDLLMVHYYGAGNYIFEMIEDLY